MRLRIELFVDDLARSVDFYTRVLGFEVLSLADDYVSVRRGAVVIGLGPVAKLPTDGDDWGFSQRRLAVDKGGGVEIVFELDGISEVAALHDHCLPLGVVVDDLELRPWGLWDFRVTDPDGYYLRITHGNAADAPS